MHMRTLPLQKKKKKKKKKKKSTKILTNQTKKWNSKEKSSQNK